MSPSVIRGVWCDESGNWITDNILLCYLAFNSSGSQELTSWQEIADLKNAVREADAKYGSNQDEIWLVSHQVRRQLGPELDSHNNPPS